MSCDVPRSPGSLPVFFQSAKNAGQWSLGTRLALQTRVRFPEGAFSFLWGIFTGPLPQVRVSGSLIHTWKPSSNLGRTNDRRSVQAYHTDLPRKVYCSCQASMVCVASVSVEIQVLLINGRIEQCACEFQVPPFVSPLSHSSHG